MRAPIVAALLAVVAIAAATTAASRAQTYSTPAPVPRTTSAPALRAYAMRREIEERFAIGLDALAASKWAPAASEFERILALKPAEPQGSTAHYDLAIAYANLHRPNDAAAELRAALDLDPGFLAAMANLIAIDIQRGDLVAARAMADRYVSLAPDAARALYSRGILALSTGDARTAAQDFGKLLGSNPAYALAHYDLALAEERLGRYDEAERELRSALLLSPTYARAQFALGAVLLRQGRRAQAREAFAAATTDAAGDPALQTIAAAMRDAITH